MPEATTTTPAKRPAISDAVRRRTTRLLVVAAALGLASFATADAPRTALVSVAPPAAAPAPAPKPLIGDAAKTAAIESIERPGPDGWLPSHGRECRPVGRFRAYCNGPRRAPRPEGEPAQLAEQLGLNQTARHWFLSQPPAQPWVEAVHSVPSDNLLLPIAGARIGRGVGHTRRVHRAIPHLGVDIGAPVGAMIRAINDGLVAFSDNTMRGYGNVVVLIHADGSTSLYAHCRETWVFPGERVERGQTIGVVGVTGITGGPHLHFEYRRRGRVTNPVPLFAGLPPSQQGRTR